MQFIKNFVHGNKICLCIRCSSEIGSILSSKLFTCIKSSKKFAHDSKHLKMCVLNYLTVDDPDERLYFCKETIEVTIF